MAVSKARYHELYEEVKGFEGFLQTASDHLNDVERRLCLGAATVE